MSLSLDEVREVGIYARNFTRAYHEDGMDWEHWSYFPGGEGSPLPDTTDGHDYAGMKRAPDEGWVHEAGCSCQYSPRCMEGERAHGRERKEGA